MILEAFSDMWSAISLDGRNPKDPTIAKFLGLGKENSAGVQVTEEKVLALPAIKRAVQIVTDKMFGMPWYVFEENEDGRTWVREHSSWRAVNWMANEEMAAPSFRQIITQWAMTWGNGCAWIDRSERSERLYPLLPDRTKAIRLTAEQATYLGDDSLMGKLYIETRIGGERKIFDYEDVIHIKGIGGNGYWGWDIIELLSETFGGAMAKEEFSNRFFSNGANPVGFIQMDGSLDEESEETYMQSLSQAMSGLGKAHKLILLEEGAKFTPVTIDPIKSQMLEGKQFDVRLLAMAIGIKPHKLIDGANSAFASLESANHEHKDDDILPWVNKFRVEYDRKMLHGDEGESGRYSIDVDDETLDWVPFAERAAGAVEMYNNGLITKDEGRRKVNFGPSKTKRAKQYRIPANIIYEDDAAMIPTQPMQTNNAQDDFSDQLLSQAVSHLDVADAYIDRLQVRLNNQAKSKAKNGKEFLTWLDSLATEQGPKSIQARIDGVYNDTKKRLNELAATKTEKELCDAI